VSVRAKFKYGGDVAWILRQPPGIDKGTGRNKAESSMH
jgi:hypothetical protein